MNQQSANRRGGRASRPGGGSPQARLQEIADRVHSTYGAFGVRTARQTLADRHILEDDGHRTTLRIIAGVTVASIVMALTSRPAWSGGEWVSALRFDSVFIVLWGPLLFVTMTKRKAWQSLRI